MCGKIVSLVIGHNYVDPWGQGCVSIFDVEMCSTFTIIHGHSGQPLLCITAMLSIHDSHRFKL